MLPSALRVQPRWIAAGGLAGGLSCIAVATLVSPAAIAALPIWSVLGMVLGVAGAAGVATRTEPSDTPEVRSEIAEAVRAATLHALVLELQGRGETVISRVLEGTLEESLADQSPSDAELVERWLTAIRHRYDIALAAETSP